MKIAVTSDVLVRAVLQDDESQSFAAEQVLKSAELIAVSIPSICEFVEILTQTYELDEGAVVMAVRSLIDAANVAVDRSAVSAGLAMLEIGGSFIDGVVAIEGHRLGARRFVSFDLDTVARIERIVPQYKYCR